MNRRIAGLLIGLFIGVALFVGATATIITVFFRLIPTSPNTSPSLVYNHVFAETLFWVSPLFLVGLVLSVMMAFVGWPIVGFWIGGRASQQSQSAHRRYSLWLGGGLGFMLAFVCNLSIFFPAQLVRPWPFLLAALTLLQLGAGLLTGYLLSILLWREPTAAADRTAQAKGGDWLRLTGQLVFLLLLPAIVCVGGLWLASGGWRAASSVAATVRPTATPSPVVLALDTLPVAADGLRPDDLLLLNSQAGVLALRAGQTTPLPWQSAPDDLTAVLATPYTQFDHHFYSADGRHADLSLLPHPPNGTVRVSPNGRYIAYETAPRSAADADLGPLLHLYNLETGEDMFISRENAIFDWSADSRYLYTRFRDRVFRYEPEAEGDRVTGLPAVNPQGNGAPALLAAADGLVFRVYSNLYWRSAEETAPNVSLGPTQIARPFALSPDGRSLAWIRVLPPQLMVQRDLPQGAPTRPLPGQNQIYHLAWSPQADRLVVWAENGCQPGTTTLPNPENCPGDLYLVDLAAAGDTAVTRLTNSGIGFQQVIGLAWLQP